MKPTPALPGSAPVRKIGKSRRAISGTLASSKAGGGAEYESALERDHYLGLEFDPKVVRIVPQPVVIHYQDAQGKRRRYTPDTLVHYHGGRCPQLTEVKYVQEVREKAALFAVTFRAARSYAREQGWTFALVTERTIRAPHLKTAQFLRPYLRREFAPAVEAEVLAALRTLGQTTPQRLLAALPEDRRIELIPVLWKLIAERRVGADLSVLFTMSSVIGPGGQDE
jgi:TnsA endonuclease N terminal